MRERRASNVYLKLGMTQVIPWTTCLFIPSQVLNFKVRNKEPVFLLHPTVFAALSIPISAGVAQARGSVTASTIRHGPQLPDYI